MVYSVLFGVDYRTVYEMFQFEAYSIPRVNKLLDCLGIAASLQSKTKKEVRRFLGPAGYYQGFIPNFAELTRP